MIPRKNLRVLSVDAGSPAAFSGMKKGDIVVSVDGRTVSDEFDFRFHTARELSRIVVVRNAQPLELVLRRSFNAILGLHFVQRPVGRCANRCIFCFINQLPRGLRKSLYVKDEDIGHSFANGNYVTLASTTYEELERIAGIGLSPLFVSVHATNKEVRCRLLGNPRAHDVLDQLRFLAKNGVSFHTQIVVCPGINDGRVLHTTISDLLSLKQGLLSVAVVPVGLTKHRKLRLTPVNGARARAIIAAVSKQGEQDRIKSGARRVFCADELFVKAGLSIPGRTYYADYPQIENGVGLVRQLLDEWQSIKREATARAPKSLRMKPRQAKRILLVTSQSAARFLARIAFQATELFPGLFAEVLPVPNEFFGSLVTVAGLLTGQDIIRAVNNRAGRWDFIVVPRVVFNHKGHTLDGYSAPRLGKEINAAVSVVDSLRTLVSLMR